MGYKAKERVLELGEVNIKITLQPGGYLVELNSKKFFVTFKGLVEILAKELGVNAEQ